MPRVRMTLRRRLLYCFQAGLYWTGAGAAYLRLGRIAGAVILMYHSVPRPSEEEWIDPRNRISCKLFRAQMEFLARHRHVIPMAALTDALRGRQRLDAGTVVLTFDDGYRDTLEVAAPILAQHGLPATLYLPTGYVGRGETQWVDQLHTMFQLRKSDCLAVDGPGQRSFDLGDRSARREAYRLLCSQLLEADWAERERLLSRVGEYLRPAARPPRLTLTWEETRELIRRHPLFDIGAHTVDHVDLRTHGGPVARAEIEQSTWDVQRELGRRPQHFSFPYSRFGQDAVESVKALGFRSAVAAGDRFLIDGASDRFALPRIEAPRSMTLLRFWTSGAYPGLPKALLGRA